MENKISSVESPVTFHIYRKDGSPNPDIKRSFLEKRYVAAIEAAEGYITLEDQTKWQLVMEEQVKKALKASDNAYCLVSFQIRTSGNYAVARLYDATKDKAAKRKGETK